MIRTIYSRFRGNSSNLKHDSYQDRPKYVHKTVPEKKIAEKEGKLYYFLVYFIMLKK